MKRRTAGLLSVFTIAFLVVVDVLATCGGGGGGGTGGMGGGGGGAEVVYQVPWKVRQRDATRCRRAASSSTGSRRRENELKKSSLRNSRTLTLYAPQCVTMGVADAATPLGQKFAADEKLPVAVLAAERRQGDRQGAGATNGKLKVGQVEKLLEAEMKQREAGVKGSDERGEGRRRRRATRTRAIAQFKTVTRAEVPVPEAGARTPRTS